MTPRQVAVEQLLSHKLYASSSQQDSYRAQSAEGEGPVTPQSPKGGAPAASVTMPPYLEISLSGLKVPAQLPQLPDVKTALLHSCGYVHPQPTCCTTVSVCVQDQFNDQL